MKIKLSDIKRFIQNSSFIKTNNVSPILEYIKFKDGEITKNNLAEFIVQESEFKGTALVEERILNNLVSVATGDITITVSKNKVTLTDGKTTVSCQREDISNFPTNDIPDDNLTKIDDAVLQSIYAASMFVDPENVIPLKTHVFIGGNAVSASNGYIMYYKEHKGVPEVVLTKATANKVGSLKNVLFSSNGSYNFFVTNGVKFGFIKPEVKWVDFLTYVKIDAAEKIHIDKSELVIFNELCISASTLKTTEASFQYNDGLALEMNDALYDVQINKTIPMVGELSGKFSYSPTQLNRLLKSIPDQEITIHKGDRKCFITGDSGFTSLIMEIVYDN